MTRTVVVVDADGWSFKGDNQASCEVYFKSLVEGAEDSLRFENW